MTIAIAATFPWGVLKAANSIPELSRFGGVILVTDSRWSYEDGPPDDMGGKLYRLAPQQGIGAVFAGDVYAAEDGLKRAQKRLELAVRPDGVTVGNVVSGALREVYSAHKRQRLAVGSLSVLVGMIEPSGLRLIIRLSSSDDFVPHVQEDVQIIGALQASKEFRHKLAESEAAFLAQTGEVRRLDIREGALRLAVELFAGVIEPGIDRTVGGPL